MIEQKDYLMRLIHRIVEVLIQTLAGNRDQLDTSQLDDMLEELSGLPGSLLLNANAATISGLVQHIPDANRIALIGAILQTKGNIAQRQQWSDAGQRLLEGVSPDHLFPETKQMLKHLQSLEGSS